MTSTIRRDKGLGLTYSSHNANKKLLTACQTWNHDITCLSNYAIYRRHSHESAETVMLSKLVMWPVQPIIFGVDFLPAPAIKNVTLILPDLFLLRWYICSVVSFCSDFPLMQVIWVICFNGSSFRLSAGLLRQATYTTTRLGVYTYLLDVFADKDGNPPGFFKKAILGKSDEDILTVLF